MNDSIRKQFPILERTINGKPLVYLDNAATTQKPRQVLDAIQHYYTYYNANVHRGIHTLSQEATVAMEDAREKVRNFINAEHAHEVIFTRGVTESINLLAYAIEPFIQSGDEILISELEHHSNIVPWQMLCEKTGAKLNFIPINDEGLWDLSTIDLLISKKTKLVACNGISNALGVVNEAKKVFDLAKEYGAMTFLDAAQLAPHGKLDVRKWDCDFMAFSAHKLYGPTGVGILYGKTELLEKMNPYHGGGEMIKDVFMDHSTYAGLPFKYEAGTPNICGNIALGAAIDFMNSIGLDVIQKHENELLEYCHTRLKEVEGLVVLAEKAKKSGAISFNLNYEGVHPSDVGMILDKKGIAVRTGHHCAQPIMRKLGLEGTVRASFAIYNTQAEIDALILGLNTAVRMLQ